MILKTGTSLYRLNLIRDRREKELKSERQQRLAVILGLGCFGFFILSILYSGMTILQMERILTLEKEKVEKLQQEYRKYTAAKLIVDKADVELLNDLQTKGVFWTRKLSALAKHLPDNYWITSFTYGNSILNVKGHGFANAQQDQLIVLNEYLDKLRQDTTFSDTFTRMQMNLSERKEDGGGVNFDFSAFTSNVKAK
jgi:Tfp pilus assembly protein PilN